MHITFSKTLTLFLIIIASALYGAPIYWVGDGGNWTDGNHWAFNSGGPGGAGVPGIGDDIIFDANSFTMGGQEVVVDANILVNSMDWTGVTNNPRFGGSGTFEIALEGSLTFSPDMLHTFAGDYTFASSIAGNTITSAGQPFLRDVIFNGTGEWTLQDPMQVALAVQIIQGTFISNDQNINVFTFFSDTQLNRNIQLGNSIVTIDQRAAGNASALILGGDNLTWSGANTSFEFRGTSSFADLNGDTAFEFGALNFSSDNSLIRTSTSINPSIGELQFLFNGEIVGDLTIDEWTLSMGQTVFLSNGSRQIVTDIITGDDCDGLASIIVRNNIGANATIEFSRAPSSISGLFLKGVDADSPGGRTILLFASQDGGGNGDLWVFQDLPSRDLYWVGGTGDWNDSSNWSSTSGGAGGECIPKPNDNIFFDNNSFMSPMDVVSGITPAFANNLTWDASNFSTVEIRLPELYLNNDLTLTTLINWNIPDVYLVGNDEAGGSSNTDFQVLNTGPNTLINIIAQSNRKIVLDAPLMLSGELNLSTSITGNTFDTGGFSVTTQSFVATDNPISLILNGSTITITGPRIGLDMPVTINQIGSISTTDAIWIFTSENSGITSDSGPLGSLLFEGQTGLSIINSNGVIMTNAVTFLGDGQFSGEEISITALSLSAGHSYTFDTNTSHSVGFTLSAPGTICSPINIMSNVVGVQAVINADPLFNSAPINTGMSYVNIQDISIIGANEALAGIGSADLGNNNGWTFPSDSDNEDAQQFLGRDRIACEDETLILQPFQTSEITRIIWANDSSETLIFEVPTNTSEVIATAFFPDGCSLTDTVAFDFRPAFDIDLGRDTTICEGESLQLDATVPGANYLWNNGDTSAQIIPMLNGDFIVQAERGGCFAADTINISIIDIESFEFPNDTTLCDNTSLVIAAPAITSGSFIWSDGTSSASASVFENTTLWVEVSQGRCTLRDSVTVTFDPDFELTLGNDTTICEGQSLILSPIPGLDNYNWSDNSSDPTLEVSTSGSYNLEASRGVCTNTASVDVNVSVITPFSIGEDITRCEGENFEIQLPTNLTLPSTWSDGSDSTILNITTSGTYWLEVQEATCTRRDSLEAIFEPLFALDLGNDTTLCNNQTLVLSTPYTDGNFAWGNLNSGQATVSDQTIEVDFEDVFFLNLQRGACTVSDSIAVTYNILEEIDLGSDTTLCEGVSLTLDIGDFPNANIMWNDGNMDSVRTVTSSGIFFVEVVVDECATVGTINVNFDPAINLNIGNDQTACTGDTITIDATATNADNYNWSTGSDNSSIIVTSSGAYILAADRGACTEIDTVEITYLDLDALNLGADRVSCSGETITFDGSLPGIMDYQWTELNAGTDVSTEAAIDVTENGTYRLAASSQGCSTEDTVAVQFDIPIPFMGLGRDSTICEGDELNYNVNFTDVDIAWSDGTSSPDFTINTPGTYTVDLTRGGCQESDTVEVQVRPLPMVSLVDTERACQGSTVTLNATTANVNYIWSNGETTPMISTTTAGTFVVTLTDDQCSSVDSTIVTFIDAPVISLRPDTTVCDGTSLLLDPMANAMANLDFRWNTGALTPSINVTTPDTYIVTVTNDDNCVSTDSFALSVNQTPTFQLPETIIACEGDAANLLVIVTSDNFVWSTGETSQSIDVNTSSLVWAEAAIGSCVFRDSAEVTIQPNPIVMLPDDTAICDGTSIDLDVTTDDATYLWSNGETSNNITVTDAGNYDVNVTVNGCTSNDDINIAVNPNPTIDLGPDQTICQGETANLNAGGGAWTTQWSTGETTSEIDVDASETIQVRADLNGCIVEDEVMITVQALPEFDLGEDISRCEQFSTTLLVDRNDVDVLWSTGDIGRAIEISEAGTYTATAMTDIGCTFVDAITVSDRACRRFSLYVPNAFAPESDGPNDKFYVSPSPNATIISYNMRVFDRWGGLMHATTDINDQWDGRTPNYGIQPGVYTYAIEIRYSDDFETDRTDYMKGSVTLIR